MSYSSKVNMFKWNIKGSGYEVSTKGDKRFSAFCATLPDKRSIECHYQCDVKGYDVGGNNWRLGKGKPSLREGVDIWTEYLELWRTWAKLNPNLIEELKVAVVLNNYMLIDRFAKTPVNQARALACILNEIFPVKKQS